jgi:soluble lytic murein transglycosylase-like protein
MEDQFLLSEETQQREAAGSIGCLSVLLFPPVSVLLFGGILLFALLQIRLASAAPARIASFFSPSVQRWETQIIRWANEHDLDPNLVATVMQIESCGDPLAVSPAGATGLFQVMPYHFSGTESQIEPDTNAHRGLDYLKRSLENFGNDASLALAGYNGGINGATRPQNEWAQETRDYVYWGEHIYADARSGAKASDVLEKWLAAGGASLCAQAEQSASVFQ